MTNPVVFFDVQIAGQDAGRIKVAHETSLLTHRVPHPVSFLLFAFAPQMELFADVCPKTAENFRLGTAQSNNASFFSFSPVLSIFVSPFFSA